MATKREFSAQEEEGWKRLIDVIESLTPFQLQEPGYFPEGWTVKDLMAHIGAWQAKAVQILEQIRMGTYRSAPIDVDEMNERFYQSNRDLPLADVRAELWAARTRMLTEWNLLPEITSKAEEWFVESGPAHYAEHLPRLQEWASELRSR
jgi:hypothetical protein